MSAFSDLYFFCFFLFISWKWNVFIFIDNIVLNLIFHTIFSHIFLTAIGLKIYCDLYLIGVPLSFLFCIFLVDMFKLNHHRSNDGFFRLVRLRAYISVKLDTITCWMGDLSFYRLVIILHSFLLTWYVWTAHNSLNYNMRSFFLPIRVFRLLPPNPSFLFLLLFPSLLYHFVYSAVQSTLVGLALIWLVCLRVSSEYST